MLAVDQETAHFEVLNRTPYDPQIIEVLYGLFKSIVIESKVIWGSSHEEIFNRAIAKILISPSFRSMPGEYDILSEDIPSILRQCAEANQLLRFEPTTRSTIAAIKRATNETLNPPSSSWKRARYDVRTMQLPPGDRE